MREREAGGGEMEKSMELDGSSVRRTEENARVRENASAVRSSYSPGSPRRPLLREWWKQDTHRNRVAFLELMGASLDVADVRREGERERQTERERERKGRGDLEREERERERDVAA